MRKTILTTIIASLLLTGCASFNGNGLNAQEQGAAVSQCKTNGLSSVVYSTDDAKVMKISCYPVAEDISYEVEVDEKGRKLSFLFWLLTL